MTANERKIWAAAMKIDGIDRDLPRGKAHAIINQTSKIKVQILKKIDKNGKSNY
jgi:hypothetical protein